MIEVLPPHPGLSAAAQALWRFSVALYRRPGIAGACLALQDRYDVDVNVLLYACWAAKRGTPLTVEQCRDAVTRCASWRDNIVLPLRAIRREVKARLEAEPQLAFVYNSLKASELQAEQAQQALLANQLAAAENAATVNCLDNCMAYLAVIGVCLDGAAAAELALIADAAQRMEASAP